MTEQVKMNPEAKAKVVEALRSGKYEQWRGALYESGCFCVWGVICDVSGKDVWVPSRFDSETMRYGEKGDIYFPQRNVTDWAGIDGNTRIVINGADADLMSHNDNGISFALLATAIEEQL